MTKFYLFKDNGYTMKKIDDFAGSLEEAKEWAMLVLARDEYLPAICIYRENLYLGTMYQYIASNPANNGTRWNPAKWVKETVEIAEY